MVYTNLYIVFEKIKKERIPLEYVDWELCQNNMDSRELNEQIKKSIDYVAQNTPESDTEYITLMEDGSYHVADSSSKDNGLKMLKYKGHKYLYLVCNQYEILINYEPEGKDFCYRVDYRMWEYIPDKEDFYRPYFGKDYYILNTYDAFCNYANQNLIFGLSKELNKPFFDEMEKRLQNSNINLGIKACMPMQFAIIRESGNTITTFTIVVYDYLIIIVDYMNLVMLSPAI